MIQITVLDTETTGLDPTMHEIIEVACIQYKKISSNRFDLLSKNDFKIKPTNILLADNKALQLNGYNEEVWKDGVDAGSALGDITEIVNKTDLLIGQNLLFDMKFVVSCCEKNDLPVPDFPTYIDIKYTADGLKKKGETTSSSLDGLCKYFGIENNQQNRHSALYDCELVWEVYKKILNGDLPIGYFTYDSPYDPYEKNNTLGEFIKNGRE